MYAMLNWGKNINNLDDESRGASRYEFRVNEFGIVMLVANPYTREHIEAWAPTYK